MDAETIRALVTYDPITGIFTWNSDRRRVKTGDVAGCLHEGWRVIKIKGKVYRAGRLAFLYMTGEWPKGEADHENRCRSDDRWSNLRDLTKHQNQMNKSGRGVYRRGKRWVAKIGYSRKFIHLGTFGTESEALAARAEAKSIYHKVA